MRSPREMLIGVLGSGVAIMLTAGALPAQTCISVPNQGAPTLSAPANFASIVVSTSPVQVVFRWLVVNDPQQIYMFHLEEWPGPSRTTTRDLSSATNTPTTSMISSSDENTPDLSRGIHANARIEGGTYFFSKNLTRGRVYKWRVRARNCGQAAAWSALSTFTIK